MNTSLTDLVGICHARLEQTFLSYLDPAQNTASLLAQAMSYAAMNGGKRIRPLLTYATGLALDATLDELDIPACAIELVHTYSLIHDDLPAMDNSDLRRGKPTCHKQFGEAIAILAGDALQTLAFQLLATHPANLTSTQRLAMVAVLANASGMSGIAGGQTLDITPKNSSSAAQLLELYHLKTGIMLTASVHLGILCAPTCPSETQSKLLNYAECLGLAFQLQDDLLDIESNSETLGKPQGIDLTNQKITYPSLVGIEKTREKIFDLTQTALDSIEFLGKQSLLHEIAEYLLQRKN